MFAILGDQWLQIDIGPPTLVTGVITKGRGDSRKSHWVKRFMVTYSNDSVTWYNYKDAHHLDPKVRLLAIYANSVDPDQTAQVLQCLPILIHIFTVSI